MPISLEACIEAESEASTGRNGITGEEAAEVDDVEAVIQVVSIRLEAHVMRSDL